MIEMGRDIIDALKSHALREAPREACGVLAGRKGAVEEIYECRNASKYPETIYEIAPAELLKTLEDIESRDMEVLGFYHSHPMGLDEPSLIDEGRATWPGYSYVIVSISGESSVSSWRWDEAKNKFEKEEVKVR